MKLGVPWTSKGKKRPERPGAGDETGSMHDRLDDLTQRLERFSRAAGAKTRAPAEPAVTGAAAQASPHPKPRSDPSRPSPTPPSLDQILAQITARQRSLDTDSRGTVRREADPPRPPTSQPVQDRPGLEEQLRKITMELEALRRPRAIDEAVPALKEELSGISRALADTAPRRAIEALEGEVHGLSHKIDTIVSSRQNPTPDALAQLTQEVRGIAARLGHGASAAASDAVADLRRQIGTITAAIAQSRTHGQPVPAQLEGMVRDLGGRIEGLQSGRSDAIAVGQLEERIAKLVEKLDASGPRFNHLEAIERGLADVLVHLEEQRGRAAGALPASGGDTALDSVKRDLDSVHSKLNRMVGLLETIEAGVRDGKAPAAVPAPPTPAAPIPAKAPVLPAATAAPAGPLAPPSERLAAAAQAQWPSAPRERSPVDPDLPPDHPLEPRAPAARAPSDRTPAADATDKSSATPDTTGKANFVAAARRAAQGASRAFVAPPEKDATAESESGSDEPPKDPSSLRQWLSTRVVSILVGISVFVIALSALHMAITLIVPSTTTDASKANKSAQVPEILPPPNSISRLMAPDPIATGSVAPAHSAAASSPAPASVDQPPSDPSSEESQAPSAPQTGPVAPAPAADVTGSIPSATPTPSASATPLPPQRPAELQSKLAMAATAGDPAAAYELAVRYIDGKGVERSYEEAAHWLDVAGKHGLAPAQFRLGSLYEKGLGVKKNLNEARRLYAAAAAKGNAKAMHNLAVLYAEGIDGHPDYRTAAQWFRNAAERGIADSQFNLGVLYARGVGVEQNLAESYKWFALAAQRGDHESSRKRDEIAARLDADTLMAARLAAKTWTPEPQPEEATTVKTPADGWDRPAPAAVKRRTQTGSPMKLSPG